MHSARISAKKMMENTTGLTPLNRGWMDSSKVVAPVRGMASMGPMHSTMAVIKIAEGIRPTRRVMPSVLPHLSIANSATRASPMSAR